MGLVWNIIGFIILIIIVALVIFILYEYFINKGANICGMSSVRNSPIFSSLCKCPGADGKDLNGDCYTCPTENGVKTGRTPAAVTEANACSYSRLYTANGDLNCSGLYGTGSYEAVASGKCYSCPPNTCKSTIDDIEGPQACGPCGGIANQAANYDGLSVFPANITTSVLF